MEREPVSDALGTTGCENELPSGQPPDLVVISMERRDNPPTFRGQIHVASSANTPRKPSGRLRGVN